MFGKYMSAVLRRTFSKDFVFFVDGLQILAASAVPLYFWHRGWKLPDETITTVLAYIGMAALAFLVLRFITAPYLIWCDQENTIVGLKNRLDEPARASRERIGRQVEEKRLQLWDKATHLRDIARRRGRGVGDKDDERSKLDDQFKGVHASARTAVEFLRHDGGTFRLGHQAIHLCAVIMELKRNCADDREQEQELDAAMQELWQVVQGASPDSSPGS